MDIRYSITATFIMHIDAPTEEETTVRFNAMTHEPDFVQEVIDNLTEGGLDADEVQILGINPGVWR